MGQVVLRENIEGKESVAVDASNWKAGMYIIVLSAESGRVVHRKVMIQ